MKKFFTLTSIFLLITMNINVIGVNAEPAIEDENDDINLIQIYKDPDLEEELISLPEGSLVVLKEIKNGNILKVEFDPLQDINNEFDYEDNGENTEETSSSNDDEEPILLEHGYINKIDILIEEELELDQPIILLSNQIKDESEEKLIDETNIDGSKEDGNLESYDDEEGSQTDSFDNIDEAEGEETVEQTDILTTMTTMSMSFNMSSLPSPVTYYGVALKNTNVYSDQSKSSKVLKGYSTGSILKYEGNDTTEWYEATVKVNGKWEKGFIYHADVENGTNNPNTIRGIGLKNKTHVYSNASTSSKKQKSYAQGTLLKYQTFTKDWYKATVMLSGKWVDGYIHRTHVEEPVSKQETLNGIGLKSPTRVYKKASTSSASWKSYSEGTLLKYKTFTKDWYEATVKVNGKWETGYIHKSHVKEPSSNSTTLYGAALNSKTHVYSKLSTSSKKLKSYNVGTKLKYQTYTDNWYEARVLVNGKYVTGYIHKSHVDELIDKQKTLHGFASKSMTSVYKNVATSSGVIKSYKEGSLLKYKSYSKNWFEATVYVSGKKHIGYIRKSDVITLNDKKVVIDAGHGGSDPGASGNGLQEKNITLDIAKKVEKLLRNSGFEVVMTRTNDKYLSLKERTDIANKANADIFVSIHVNAGGGTGIETWKYEKGPDPNNSEKLAQYLQDEIIKETNVANRGVRDKNLHVNRETNIPSSLVEIMFIDTKSDADKLKSPSFINKVVNGIVNGIKKFFQ